jgi:hypothetical protein
MCCPNCRSNNIAHIVYGLRGADPEEMKDIQAGDVKPADALIVLRLIQ